ncbi:MAG: PorT family protein [Bacteroidales bacterium]|nr:PorT family protein [Bacteroidales bacterium]
MNKKTLALLLFLVCIAQANLFAQNIGIKAGVNFSNAKITMGNSILSEDFQSNTGFHIGPSLEFPVSKLLSIETGAIFNTKGYHTNSQTSFLGIPIGAKTKTSLSYIDIPIVAKLSYPVGNLTVYLDAGPYIGIGISGKTLIEGNLGSISGSEENEIIWGNDNDANLKRIDYGLSLGAGVRIHSISIGALYGLGLTDAASAENTTMNHRVMSISLGYPF